jgi:hypothetical protein
MSTAAGKASSYGAGAGSSKARRVAWTVCGRVINLTNPAQRAERHRENKLFSAFIFLGFHLFDTTASADIPGTVSPFESPMHAMQSSGLQIWQNTPASGTGFQREAC